MGFDPSQPRDYHGRWTDTGIEHEASSTISNAIRKAASDKPVSKEEFDRRMKKNEEAVTTLSEQTIKNLTGAPDVRLDGLSGAEQMDVLTVFKDEINSNGLIKDLLHEGVKTYGEGSGTTEDSLNPSQTALAAYVYNPEDDVGGFELYLNTIHSMDNKSYVADSWDEKVSKAEDALKRSADDFNSQPEFIRMMAQDDYNKYVKDTNEKIERYKKWKTEGRESKPFTIPNSFEDKDKRFQSMMYHELGHMRLREAFNKEHGNVYPEGDYLKWKSTHMKAEMEKNPISDYGAASTDEYFAENYSAHKMGLPISDNMEKFIKSLNLK